MTRPQLNSSFYFSLRKPQYFVSASGTGGGSSDDPAGLAAMQDLISGSERGATFFLRGGLYEFPTGLTISKPGIEIIGSGGSDDAAPATRIYGTVTYTSGWTLQSGSIYSRTVTGTPLAVYLDQQSAWNADLNSRAIQLAVAGSPTSPGTNEWGFDAGTLYVNIGTDPASDTIRVTSSTTPIIQVLQGAADLLLRGFEVGMVGSSGFMLAAAQDANQRTATDILLDCFWTFGCQNQTLAAGAVTNNGISIQAPCFVEAVGCVFDLSENDGVSIKQGGRVKLSSCHISRAQDDLVSNHYQSHLEMYNCILRDARTNASTDGNGITVFGGATAHIENCSITTDAGCGILITNTAANATVQNKVTIKDTAVRTWTPGTAAGINGISMLGRGELYCENVEATGWQNTTASQGGGFRVDDGAISAGVTALATFKNCAAFRNRAGIATSQTNSANRVAITVSQCVFGDNSVADVSNGGGVPIATSGTTAKIVTAVAGSGITNGAITGPWPISFWAG